MIFNMKVIVLWVACALSVPYFSEGLNLFPKPVLGEMLKKSAQTPRPQGSYGGGIHLNTPVLESSQSLFSPTFVTVTSTTTRTYFKKLYSTSDVKVTSATLVSRTVTQYTTLREYVRALPETVTSVVKITKTPVEIVTATIDSIIDRTVLSATTEFVTATQTRDYWHPITHYTTSFEVVSLPVFETQTLLQVISKTETTYITSTVTITQSQISDLHY